MQVNDRCAAVGGQVLLDEVSQKLVVWLEA
jgi:hypothetical protein